MQSAWAWTLDLARGTKVKVDKIADKMLAKDADNRALNIEQ